MKVTALIRKLLIGFGVVVCVVLLISAISWVRLLLFPLREEHWVQQGFEGPVVVVFEAGSSGSIAERKSEAPRYEIPPDGVLHVASTLTTGLKSVRYYETGGGARQELPASVEPDKRQVFGVITGSLPIPGRQVEFIAYLVGVPESRTDWFSLREAAVERVARAEEMTVHR